MAQVLYHLGELNEQFEACGLGYDAFCANPQMTVAAMVEITAYDEYTIRQWIDYCEGLIDEFHEPKGE